MAPYVYWFLLALGLMALEMATGTFYLLVLGIALAIGGMAALLGLSVPLQLTLSAIAGVTGTVILRRMRRARVDAEPNQNLDIGQQVQRVSWREGNAARVYYRGTEWDAILESPNTPHEGALYIKAMNGSTLVLTHHKPDDTNGAR